MLRVDMLCMGMTKIVLQFQELVSSAANYLSDPKQIQVKLSNQAHTCHQLCVLYYSILQQLYNLTTTSASLSQLVDKAMQVCVKGRQFNWHNQCLTIIQASCQIS